MNLILCWAKVKKMNILNRIANTSLALLYEKLKYKILQFRCYRNKHPTEFFWNWGKEGYNRIALVNVLISKTGGYNSKYLEIGCAGNALFNSVPCRFKIGVDPEKGGTNRQTSDEFFINNNDKFDVIFIDGMHSYEQVRKDAINAIGFLHTGGWIAFHDFLPSNWREQNIPRLQWDWTGDCWKLALELANTNGIDFRIVSIDRGIGILKLLTTDPIVEDYRAKLTNAGFDTFVASVPTLPIITWDEAVMWINAS